MTALPVITSRQLIRALEKAGFFLHHVTGSHHFFKHPDHPTRRVTVPFHNKDLKRGTLRAILKEAGLSVDELVDLL